MPTLEIVNVVSTADLKQPVDLFQISKISHISYDQESYGGRVAYFKHPEMNGKVSIFSSGKMISVGTKSQEQAISDLRKTRDILLDNDFIKKVKIQMQTRNIVALQRERGTIDIEGLSYQENVVYEPEQFPGAILRYNNPKVTFLIFASGKIVITGVKSLSDLTQTSSFISQKLEKYI